MNNYIIIYPHNNSSAAGGVCSSVSYTQSMGAVTSLISQVDADTNGLTKFNNEGQANANANGYCTFSSVARSGSFTKNNCAPGGVGSSVGYSLLVGAVTSITSQADADAQALTKFNNEGQANANANGYCMFSSVARSGSFTKSNCAAGGVGSSVGYSLPVGAVTSTTSQADADAQALTKFNNEGQANANANGYCTFSSAARSGSFTKSNCAAGGVGSSVGYSLPVGAVTSTNSQADADAQALTKFNNEGQANANANGYCTFSSAARSGSFTKINCAAGGVGSSVGYSLFVGAVTLTTSQADADAQALTKFNNEGQANANTYGTCTFRSIAKSGTYNKNNCAVGGVGSTVTYTVVSGVYTSAISQADADTKAQNDVYANGQVYANTNGTCTFTSIAKSGTFTKNNCATGGTGSLVTYTVAAGAYSSTSSQADVDAMAQSAVNNNGQAYANSTGLCVFYNKLIYPKFYKTDCPEGTTNPYVYYFVDERKYQSVISQADADNKAWAEANANGPAYANETGRCLYPGELEE